MLPFLIVLGLTVFAVGIVRVVEIGAAGNSKRLSAYKVEPHQGQPTPKSLDYELAQRDYQDMMRRHSELRQRTPKPMNQVAYQLSLEHEAIRELSGLPSGKLPPPNSPEDVLDWSLFEQGDIDPRSALKRGTSSFDGSSTHGDN